jgi:excisionase family DNA binding protein
MKKNKIKETYTVTQYAQKKNISRTAVQKQINKKKIRAFKIGRQWVIESEIVIKTPKQFKLKL